MMHNDPRYAAYARVLRRHLRPAMGCTEPIAIAYAAAVARAALGRMPDDVRVLVSGNIIKNAKSVTVPNTGGLKGIDAAGAAGIVAGDETRELQVIADVTPEQIGQIAAYAARGSIIVGIKPDARLFDILVTVRADGHEASARIADRHTNVVHVERDGETLHDAPLEDGRDGGDGDGVDRDEAMLTVEGIFDFAKTCDLADVRESLERQLECNMAIAEEGVRGMWGAAVGCTILAHNDPNDPYIRAKAMAAAGSDARMSGCEMPVIINSGSGNQGITVCVPVAVFAEAIHATHEELLRALAFANLIAIREKGPIGCLSAYCGAISAGCAAGAGIAFLRGGSLDVINHTIVNSLAILSGTICDGAKPSCAAKIACAVDAALLGYHMALSCREFRSGEGIVTKGVENTIANVGRLGKDGMKETDHEILRIMTGC